MAQGLKGSEAVPPRSATTPFHFNWMLKIDESFQRPFEPTHENMASLQLSRSLPPHELAANLRRAFSRIRRRQRQGQRHPHDRAIRAPTRSHGDRR